MSSHNEHLMALNSTVVLENHVLGKSTIISLNEHSISAVSGRNKSISPVFSNKNMASSLNHQEEKRK